MRPVDSPPINTPEWEKWRQDHALEYLSASEAAQAAGLSPFGSPIDLLAEKAWPEEAAEDPDRDWRFYIAHLTQPTLLEAANHVLRQQTRPVVQLVENKVTFASDDPGWLIGTPDGFVKSRLPGLNYDPLRPIPVEIKFTSGWSAYEPPAHIMAQLLVQMQICKSNSVWLVVGRPHVRRLLDVTVVDFAKDRVADACGDDFWDRVYKFWKKMPKKGAS